MAQETEFQPKRTFTIEEANATLPLVRAITKDLAELSREVIERRQRIAHLTAGRAPQPGDPYLDELAAIERELEKDVARLQEFVDELLELGVVPNGLPQGLVDFPSWMDGRLVFLCWKLGEPEVLHWHEIDAGFAGRQPLTVDAAAGLGDGDDDLTV